VRKPARKRYSDGPNEDGLEEYTELIGETPDFVPGNSLDLASLGGSGAELSTGLVLTWRGKLVFGLEPRAIPLGAMGQSGISAFVGIGGHLDSGERWVDAVVREAVEEASCSISLGDSPVTYLCQQDRRPSPIAYAWKEPHRPLLVWVATFDLRRGPEQRRMPVTLVTAVFRAAALGQPAPGAEIHALLLMDQAALLHAYHRPRPLGELLDRGAQLIGNPLPYGTLVAPGGSAYFYAQWLAWQEEKPVDAADGPDPSY
jgi:8-oxo-dGTP pyrophosphatase MutT (NUDIX family)